VLIIGVLEACIADRCSMQEESRGIQLKATPKFLLLFCNTLVLYASNLLTKGNDHEESIIY
jgi:hypothetical protein